MKILLVDDDRIVLAATAPGLRAAGLEVETANGGEQAIESCLQAPPDLVLLDMRMPGMDGVTVARWLRGHTKIPFLFLSAYSDDELVAQAIQEGAAGYLVKPVPPAQLLIAINEVMDRSTN